MRYKNRYGVFCVRFVDDEKKHVVLSGRDVYYAIQVGIFLLFLRFVLVFRSSARASEFPECKLR